LEEESLKKPLKHEEKYLSVYIKISRNSLLIQFLQFVSKYRFNFRNNSYRSLCSVRVGVVDLEAGALLAHERAFLPEVAAAAASPASLNLLLASSTSFLMLGLLCLLL